MGSKAVRNIMDKEKLTEEFTRLCKSVVPDTPYKNVLFIDGKYFVSLTTNKWKVKGRDTWYRYKSAEDLTKRYFYGDYGREVEKNGN
jgi:hypothetical protein|tara:strand:+ start:1308 stop:1568 length:261 start_codon:yes stop_codon:yes gene_type:complete